MTEKEFEANIKELAKIDILVLDDYMVDHINKMNWSTYQLERIFDNRYDKYLPTMLSSNNDPWTQFPERIGSRFLDKDRSTYVVNYGDDFRKRKKAKKEKK